jgi:hypothetical protein
MTPLVSVIIPCYNQGRFLADALDSVLAQTHPHWECIIVNDGSTDDTGSVAQRYTRQDARFKYIEQENRGLSAARNRGLQEIRGSHVQFLDSDDIIAPDKLRLQLADVERVQGICVVYCDHYYAAPDDITKAITIDFPMPRFVLDKPLWDIASRWETELSIPVHSFLFDARIFTHAKIRFSETLPNHEDWDCWMRIFALPIVLRHVPGKLAAYRVHETSMARDQWKMWKGFSAAIGKQQRLWRSDPHMSKLLSQKSAQIDAAYGFSKNPFRNALVRASRSPRFKQHLPWRLQRLVYRMIKGKQ